MNPTLQRIILGVIKYKNAILNGNFSDGIIGWVTNLSSIAVSNSVLALTPSAQNGQVSSPNVPNITGNKLYIKYRYKIDSSSILMTVSGISGSVSPAMIADGQWHEMSYIWQCTLTGNYGLRLRDSRASGWTVSYIDYAICYDISLSGYENKSLEWCDQNIPQNIIW